MTLITKIGNVELHGFFVTIVQAAAPGSYNASVDNAFPSSPVLAMSSNLVASTAGAQYHHVVTLLRSGGIDSGFTVYGQIADGVNVYTFNTDGIARNVWDYVLVLIDRSG